VGIFKRNKGDAKALSASGGVVAAIEDGWSAMPLLGSGARQRIQNIYNVAQSAQYGWLYSRSPALRQVIDGIVRDVGALELRLYEEASAADRQPRPDHPAALSLRYPSTEQTGDQLNRALALDKLIYDNAYALLTPAADDEVGLVRVPAHMVEVQGNSMFRAENYRVWPQGAWTSAGSWGGGGTPVDFTPEQILHWHGEHPHDPRIGLSHIDTLRGVIAEDAALQQANVELAQAGLQEPTWVFRPADAPAWSNAARDGFEEDLTNRMRRRTTKPVVLEEGMEMRSFGITPKDAEMMTVREWTVAQIANEYGVPRGKAGLDAASQEDEDAYMADVLVPLCKDYCSMLDLRILVRVYDWTDGCFAFNLDERVAGNARLQALVSASGAPVMLRNEARAKLNLPAVDGGDELITPLNVLVGAKPSSQVMPVQDPNKPPADGSYRLEQGQTPVPSENAGKALSAPGGASEGPSDAIPQLHPRRAADIERQHRHIDTMQAVVARHFGRLERSLRPPRDRLGALGPRVRRRPGAGAARRRAGRGRRLRAQAGRRPGV
jgi:HK97 family phage portal protein